MFWGRLKHQSYPKIRVKFYTLGMLSRHKRDAVEGCLIAHCELARASYFKLDLKMAGL